MGVAGSGKTTIGQEVCRRMQYAFFDADSYHPPDNIAKMARNEPLTDDDRAPWLTSLQDLLSHQYQAGHSAVLACSALKRQYRQRLFGACPQAKLVYLHGDYELILKRLQQRQNHFATANLLDSQFLTLEKPSAPSESVLTVEIDRSVEAIVSEIIQYLSPAPAESFQSHSHCRGL